MSDNEKTMNGEEQIAALLRRAGRRPAVPEAVKNRVYAAVHEEWRRGVRSNTLLRVVRWTTLAAAACLVAVFLSRINLGTPAQPAEVRQLVATAEVVSGNAFMNREPLSPRSQIFAHSLIETGPGAAAALRWSDRGSLRIAADSAVRVTSDREIRLERGAMYFSSSRSGQAIAVRTPFGIVRDVGTQFEVRIDRQTLRVRVREGEIDLRGTRATAGTELDANRAGAIERRPISRSGPEWDWVVKAAPPIALSGTVRDVIGVIAREKGLTPAFADARSEEAAGQMRLHGNVPVSPDEALTALTAASPFTWRIANDALIIRRR